MLNEPTDWPEWVGPPKRKLSAFVEVRTKRQDNGVDRRHDKKAPDKPPKPAPEARQPSLSEEEKKVLAELDREVHSTVSVIAEAIGVTGSTVRYHLYNLVRRRLVREERVGERGPGSRLYYYLAAVPIQVTKHDKKGRVVAHEYQNWSEGVADV